MALNLKQRRPRDITWQDELVVEWGDGVIAHYPFFALRDACPCASCVDELTGTKVLDPGRLPADVHIRSAEYVGNYGLRINWSDGHETGIYSFRFLREFLDHALEQGGDGQPYVQHA